MSFLPHYITIIRAGRSLVFYDLPKHTRMYDSMPSSTMHWKIQGHTFPPSPSYVSTFSQMTRMTKVTRWCMAVQVHAVANGRYGRSSGPYVALRLLVLGNLYRSYSIRVPPPKTYIERYLTSRPQHVCATCTAQFVHVSFFAHSRI